MAEQSKQSEFYVSQSESTLGPWMMTEIASRTRAGELDAGCFIFLESRDQWVPLMECDELQKMLKATAKLGAKPKAPPKPPPSVKLEGNVAPTDVKKLIRSAEAEVKAVSERAETTVLSEAFANKESLANGIQGIAEWFVQKGPNRYGPFTYTGLVRALQEKSIFEFDMIWKNGMDNWMRLAEHPEFSPDCIRALQEELKAEAGVFFRRQHDRVPLRNEVMVHDNCSVWMGKAFEGSAGGSGVIIENATLVPGQVVLLHFSSGDGLPAFNALCEIVSKKFQSNVNDASAPISYGLRFIKIDTQAEAKVLEFFRRKSTKTVVQPMRQGRKSSSSQAA